MGATVDFSSAYRTLIEAYDRGGLPFERVLTRLSYGRWLLKSRRLEECLALAASSLTLCEQFGMSILAVDVWELQHEMMCTNGDDSGAARLLSSIQSVRATLNFRGPARQ